MELNAEQIIKALECCIEGECGGCTYDEQTACKEYLLNDALALIKELTEENEQFRYERGKLIEERDTFREYAYNMQRYVEGINHKEEEGYQPSVARRAAEMDMWRGVALKKKKLEEEVERLRAENLELIMREEKRQNEIHPAKDLTVKADTVREMQERLEQAICDNTYPDFDKEGKPVNVWKATTGYDAIDQIAKEMLEGEKNDL